MKRLQKLKRVSDYLSAFRAPSFPGIRPLQTVDQENATGQLSKAVGDQLLIALPEAVGSGPDTDAFEETVSLAFFALAKINGPARTQELADTTYRRLLCLLEGVLDHFVDDLTGGTGHPCPLLSGLRMTGYSVRPEYSVFGGWSGYYLEITLE